MPKVGIKLLLTSYLLSESFVLASAGILPFLVSLLFKPGTRLVSYNHFHSAQVCVCVYAGACVCVCVCVCTPPRP